jgi:transcription antitermination factor NusG
VLIAFPEYGANELCSSQGEAMSGIRERSAGRYLGNPGDERKAGMETAIDFTASETGMPWWALYTRHQHEKTVAEILRTKGVEVFLPLYASMRRWRDRKKLLYMPLFPGYVFVRGVLSHRLHVMTTPGVHMILSQGDRAAAIPEDEINAIRQTVEGNYHVEPHPFLKCGERVRVKRGSLCGVEGILVRKKNVFRLVLSVQMLAQAVAVEIDASDVEAVDMKVTMPLTPNELAGARLQQYPIRPYAG